jgi:paraquat-inducible protein A
MINNINIACLECDLLIKVTNFSDGSKALCPRCGYTLTTKHCNSQIRVIAFSISALIFLLLSTFFPFLSLNIQGQERTITLIESITVINNDNFTSLATLIFITIVLIPSVYLISIIYIQISLNKLRLLSGTLFLLKLTNYIQQWNMAEIFLIGILISFIKITTIAGVSLGLSFWAYLLFILSMSAAILHYDKHQVWQLFKIKKYIPISLLLEIGRYHSCHVCTEVIEKTNNICRTCGSHLQVSVKNNLQNTWALLFTSVLLYFPANMLPIMKTDFLGEITENTLLGGVVVLWSHGSYPIAIIIFIASVLIPIGKIIILAGLCYSVQKSSTKSYQQKTHLYRITELIGRWSMVDIFVVAILVALIKFGNVINIYPGLGAIAFAAMVIITILAAISFDPRLIWNPVNKVYNE